MNNLKLNIWLKVEIYEQKSFMIVYQLYQNVLLLLECMWHVEWEGGEVLPLLKQMRKGML